MGVILVAWWFLLSPPTFALFAFDKWAARRGRRRVPERVLLGLAAMGGWPGGVVAMGLLRHKTRKARFVAVMGLAVAVHVALAASLWRASGS